MTKLYYIAIYPPQDIIDEIRVFKNDLVKNFENSRALKNDAHITLFPPFSRELNLEQDIFKAFERIDTNMIPFEIILDGFGCFPNPKNPVLFILPEKNERLLYLQQKVTSVFNFNLFSFNPHVTIGYRDLTFNNFIKAWDKYQNMEYHAKFVVDKILLLRHDGHWKTISEKRLITK